MLTKVEQVKQDDWYRCGPKPLQQHIVLEGVDAVGKTSLMQALADLSTQAGQPVDLYHWHSPMIRTVTEVMATTTEIMVESEDNGRFAIFDRAWLGRAVYGFTRDGDAAFEDFVTAANLNIPCAKLLYVTRHPYFIKRTFSDRGDSLGYLYQEIALMNMVVDMSGHWTRGNINQLLQWVAE